jgi:hypothetical protein
VERIVSDYLSAEDSSRATLQAAPSAAQRTVEEPRLSTTFDAPAAQTPPDISVISEVIQLSEEEPAIIAFQSSTWGDYLIEIKDVNDLVVNSIAGQLVEGTNYSSWEGRNASGNLVGEGEYFYYITAQSEGGVRNSPVDGDGTIMVAWSVWTAGFSFLVQNLSYVYMGILAALGCLIAYFLLHKRRLTLFIPAAAVDVVQDVLARHPDAKMEDYIDIRQGPRRYKGMTIANAGKIDNDWLKSIAGRTKASSGVDSLLIEYEGKRITI